MLKTGLQVPGNYYSRSRDFQLLGRIMDCAFNSSKLYSDMVAYDTICKNTDKRLLDLISKTLGFDVKRSYDTNDLYVLCSTFNSILKEKGTLEAVKDCVRVLLKSQNIERSFDVYDVYTGTGSTRKKEYQINILIPYELVDVALLEDMLDYVLPAGYLYNIIFSTAIQGYKSTDAVTSDTITSTQYQSDELGHVVGSVVDDSNKTHLSVVYSPDAEED